MVRRSVASVASLVVVALCWGAITLSPAALAQPAVGPAVEAAPPAAGPSGEPVAGDAPADTPAPAASAPPAEPASTGISLAPRPGQPDLHKLSPWAMFMGADVVVKGVMVGLAVASLVTWTIFLAKSLGLFLARRRLDRALARLGRCRTLREAEQAFPRQAGGLVACLIGEAADETRLSDDLSPGNGVRERVASRGQEVIRAEGRSIRVGMGLLATIGSTSPFVGLFGTVWGIMNAFVGIAKAQTTNLAVVAPGIAEALLATAIGLVAAIPAVIAYNHFARVTKSYLEQASRASGEVGRLVSRDLDRLRTGDRASPLAAAAE